MTRDLRVEMIDWLAANPAGGTASEIAKGIGARRAIVAVLLEADRGFAGPERVGAAPHTRQVWNIAPRWGGQAGTGNRWPRVNAGSQNAKVLTVLADRKWHTSRDVHRRVFCVLHSRIAELRKLGYAIEHRGGGPGAESHEYRLAGLPADEAKAAA